MENRTPRWISCRLIGIFLLAVWGCGRQSSDAVLTAISIHPSGHVIPLGRSLQLTAMGTFSDNSNRDITNQIHWSTSDTNIASVSNTTGSKGLLKTTRQGDISILATMPANNVGGTTMLTVAAPVLEAISVIPPRASIHLGSVQQFKAIGRFSDATTRDITEAVTWSSPGTSNPIVSNTTGSKGFCISPEEGTTMVAATEPKSGINGKALLALSDARLVAIEIEPKKQALASGKQCNLSAMGIYNDGTTNDITEGVVWSASNSSIASVQNEAAFKGLVTAKDPGVITIKAVDPNLIISGIAQLTVTLPELQQLQIRAPVNEAVPGKPIQLAAVGKYSDGRPVDMTQQVEWRSVDTGMALVDNRKKRGAVTPARSGRVLIQAVDPNTGIEAVFPLIVSAPRLTTLRIQPSDPSLQAGQKLAFQATGLFSDGSEQPMTQNVRWSSTSTAIAEIGDSSGKKGSVLAVSPGQAVINAIHTVSGISAGATVTVEPASLSTISISPKEPSLPLGSHMNFTAIGIFSDGTSKTLTENVSWHSSNDLAAVVSDVPGTKGWVRSKSPGTTTIRANNPFSGVYGETVLTVGPPLLITIELTPAGQKLFLGEKRKYTATGIFSDGEIKDISQDVSWSSSDVSIATIDDTPGNKGLVSAKSIGYCDIIATDPISGVFAQTTLSGRADW